MKKFKSKFIVALAAVIFAVGTIIPPVHADLPPPPENEWWVGYDNTQCNGEGIAIYNYAVLVILWGYGEVQSFRAFRFGKLRHCQYSLPYAIYPGPN